MNHFLETWFSVIANSVLEKSKSPIPSLFNIPEVLSSASDKAKLFAKNSNLEDSGTLWCLIDVPPLQPEHSYSNPFPWAIKFWEKFNPTLAFKIYTRFL